MLNSDLTRDEAFSCRFVNQRRHHHGWGLTEAIFKQPHLLVFYANAFDLHGYSAAA
jgi:hypothetical protein